MSLIEIKRVNVNPLINGVALQTGPGSIPYQVNLACAAAFVDEQATFAKFALMVGLKIPTGGL